MGEHDAGRFGSDVLLVCLSALGIDVPRVGDVLWLCNAQEYVDEAIWEADTDNDGFVDITEFEEVYTAAMYDKQGK